MQALAFFLRINQRISVSCRRVGSAEDDTLNKFVLIHYSCGHRLLYDQERKTAYAADYAAGLLPTLSMQEITAILLMGVSKENKDFDCYDCRELARTKRETT